MNVILDLFAGPGGWDIALRDLNEKALGIELDADTCQTRHAAGLPTKRADIAALDPHDYRPTTGLIASPPCQTFSSGGKRTGTSELDRILDVGARYAHGDHDALAEYRERHDDPRSTLVLEPLRWALALRPRWIACEQVPSVLPIWQAFAEHLAGHGYRSWTGLLNAADYGVPQTRTRAIFIARLDRKPQRPPATHGDNAGAMSLFEQPQPWISMADALGWHPDDKVGFPRRNDQDDGLEYRERDLRPASEPAFALTSKARSWTRRTRIPVAVNTGRDWKPGKGRESAQTIPAHRPYPTIDTRTGGRDILLDSDGERVERLTLEEASILQTFPADYPWQGSRTSRFLQLGNAIPPRLARAVLAEAIP